MSIERDKDKEIVIFKLNVLFVSSKMQDELRQQKEEEMDDYCSQVYSDTFCFVIRCYYAWCIWFSDLMH